MAARLFLSVAAALAALAFPLAAAADHGSADEASPNMLHVANLPTPPEFLTGPPNEARNNSDLAFYESYAAHFGSVPPA